MGENINKTLIIIPTYNEAENIETIITRIHNAVRKTDSTFHILVVDDKSPDGTALIVRDIIRKVDFVKLVTQSEKSLKSAYIHGFRYAMRHDYKNIVMMDADGSHNPIFINDLLRLSSQYDLVVGSRYVKNGHVRNWNLFRKLISRMGNIYSQIILNCPIRDLTSGFNLINIQQLRHIDLSKIKSNGYAFQVELKYRLLQNNFSYTETPITFVDRERGESKFGLTILLEAIIAVPRTRIS